MKKSIDELAREIVDLLPYYKGANSGARAEAATAIERHLEAIIPPGDAGKGGG